MAARIVIDEREKNSGIPVLLKKVGAAIEFAQLHVGDYIVSPETAIERKTVSDLVSSIYDGRLFVQCFHLTKHYQKPLLIVQGNLADLTEIPEDTENKDLKRLTERMPLAYDALATVATEFQIPIIHTPTAEQTAQLLLILANKSLKQGKASGPLLKRIKKDNPVYIQQLYILSSLPGVGEKLAARMLEKFKTPKKALNASAAELATIPGFGLARAENIREILETSKNDAKIIQRTLFD